MLHKDSERQGKEQDLDVEREVAIPAARGVVVALIEPAKGERISLLG